ncbi:hypothetical protein TruAng_001982 [Truncatella angustata]|nr:hypothetical protein TruAng_001982 [Truncatella angustata]
MGVADVVEDEAEWVTASFEDEVRPGIDVVHVGTVVGVDEEIPSVRLLLTVLEKLLLDVVPVTRVDESPHGVEDVDRVLVEDSVMVSVVAEFTDELPVTEVDAVTVTVEVLPITVVLTDPDSVPKEVVE